MNILNISKILVNQQVSACTDNLSDDFFTTEITGVEFDSRKIKEKSLFVAIKGVKTDGHLYIDSAIEKGAVAIICEDEGAYREYCTAYKNVAFFLVKSARCALALLSKSFYENACEKLKIIGITGTKGKTSTSFMLWSVMNKSAIRTGLIGTNGAYFEGFYEELSHSTPESLDLHRLFYKMLCLGATHIVMEVSSQSILMSRVHGIQFETGVFTNISPDHIGEGEHTDFEDYFYCKSRLFTMCKNAVVNADADRADDILRVCKENGVAVTTFSCNDKNASFYADSLSFYIHNGTMTTSFEIYTPDRQKTAVSVGVPGKFSVFNALCAISCAFLCGLSIDSIKKAIADVKVVGRIEPVPNKYCKAPVIIDYAHNKVSMESLFEAIKEYNPGRIYCVFGCGGNRSKLRRYEMGETSGNNAYMSVITTDNSRFEELDDIISDILVGINKTNGKYTIIKDRTQAIHYAMGKAEENDVVLLVGKGQETYLDIKGVKTHYDEREAVASFKG